MKKNILLAVIPGVIALAALLLSFRSPVDAAGYAVVAMLIGVATLEYRINWKRLVGRS